MSPFSVYLVFISMKGVIKKILKEELNLHNSLNEIDWEGDFNDVHPKCINPENLCDYLNRVMANAGKATKDREKFTKDKPYFHAKSDLFNKDNTSVDIDDFIKKITATPSSIIGQNEKMSKSGSQNEFVYNTGIPALRGLVYDIANNKFYVINTCPGAGECINYCYAMSGNYIRYPRSYDNMTRRLNYLLNYPEKYEEQLYSELRMKCIENKALKGNKFKVMVRWNDSGDFFSKKYVDISINVINKLKANGYNIEHYTHTKMGDVANNTNFDATSFSVGANKRETSKIDLKKQKISDIVGVNLFKGLNLDRVDDMEKLKGLLSMKLGVNKAFILTYPELMKTPESKNRKWYVITTPSDGDDAARRNDVKSDLLLQH